MRSIFSIVVAVMFLSSGVADAACQFLWTSTTNGVVTTGNAATVCSSKNYTTGTNPSVARTYTPWANTPSLPSSSTQIGYCDEHRVNTYNDGSSSQSDTLVASSMSVVESCSSSSSSSSSCSAKTGQSTVLVLATAGGAVPATMCAAGCQATVVASGVPIIDSPDGSGGSVPTGLFDVTYTGQVCMSSDEPQAQEDDDDCVTGSNGATVCSVKVDGKNCGQLNGDMVCVSSAAPGSCETLSSGAVVCVAASDGSTPTPPLPDDGVAGVPADPVVEVKDNSGSNNQTNYYTSTQISNSTVVAGSSGSSSSGSSGSGSSCSSGQTCNGASGGNDCSAAPTCNGDSVQCTILKQSWLMRCSTVNAAEAQAAFADVTDTARTENVESPTQLDTGLLGVSGGSCPEDPSFTVMGTDFTIPIGQFLCPMLIQLSGIILAVAYFLAGSMLVEAI